MLVIAGGILIAMAVLAAIGLGLSMMSVDRGAGWLVLGIVAVTVVFVIF